MYEKLLQILPGIDSTTRVELYQISEPNKQPRLEMRQMTYCGGLGWQIEKRIQLGGGAIPQLREAINLMDADARQPARTRVRGSHLTLVASGEYDEAM